MISGTKDFIEPNGNDYLLLGALLKIRNFHTEDFPLIKNFIFHMWSEMEQYDILIERASISTYANYINVVVLPNIEYRGSYIRGKIHKCKCGGVKHINIVSMIGYQSSRLLKMGESLNHKSGCGYYLVQNIMEI